MCPNKSAVHDKVAVLWMKIISWYVSSSAMFKITVVWKKQLWSVSVLLLLSEVEVMHLSAVCRPQLRYKNRRRKPHWLPDVGKMCCDVNRRKMLSQKLLQSTKVLCGTQEMKMRTNANSPAPNHCYVRVVAGGWDHQRMIPSESEWCFCLKCLFLHNENQSQWFSPNSTFK